MSHTTGMHAHGVLFLSLLFVALAALLFVPAAAQQAGPVDAAKPVPPFTPQNTRASEAVPATHLQKASTDLTPPAPVFSTGSIPSGGTFAILTAVGDLNGDGSPDIVVVNQCVMSFMTCETDGGSLSVLLNNGTGGFTYPIATYSTGGNYPYGVAVTDVNHDGKLDVVVGNSCSLGVFPNCLPIAMLLGNGDGTLQAAQPYPGSFSGLGGGSSSVTVDVNGDGIPDLITLGTTTVNVQLGNPDGTYQPAVSFDAGGYYPNVITVADVAGEGKPDLLIANTCINQPSCPNGGGSVGVLLNYSQYTATSTTLISSENPSRSGQAVTFTATVTAYSGSVPDGENVTFMNGTTVLGSAALTGGTAVLTTKTLPVGTLNITASYAYDGTYGASTGQLSQLVKAIHGYPTTLTLTANPNPAYAQAVTLSAVVTSTGGTIPDGEIITFHSGTTVMGTASTVGGVATLVIPWGFVPTTYHIQATYPGDATFQASTGTVTAVVYGNPSATYLLSDSPNPSIYGQAVSFFVIVSANSAQYPPPPPPTGEVRFMWDGSSIGSATLSGIPPAVSQATFTISTLNADTFPIQVVYSGDSLYAPSTSSVTSQVVLQATSSAMLTSSANPSAFGQAVTFTAKITSPTVVAKGPVIFTAGTAILGTVELSSGAARLTTSSLPAGTTTVTVTYNGDSNIAKSSASVAQVVQ